MAKNNNEISLGYALGRTNWYLKTLLNKLFKEEGLNITNEQWVVLKVIYINPALSQTEIAEKSLKDKTNITRILDLLEKSTWIERRKDDKDRRMNRILITKQGKKILKAVDPIVQKTNEICTHSLNKKEVKELIKSLDTVCIGIKNEL
ncbi:MAG: MarR family transcriptional regulator [Desulfobacterales bacterium]|nr:MarR family transcriptional regulator [Desulfobacterales bacterium]MCP4161990.1 MarR family transcriptional regulator [Deltaproteobacteria bacterium]